MLSAGLRADRPAMQTPRIAQDQYELFSRAQALEDGWSKGALDRALAAGRLVALAPGVYVDAETLEGDRRSRHLLEARALVLAHGDAWHLARRSAAVLHGLPLLGPAPSQVQLTRDQPPNHAHAASRHRRVHRLLPEEVTLLDGLPTTSPARTVYDIARAESFRAGLVVADGALRAGVPRAQLLAVLASHPRWPGSRRARAVMLFADGRAETPLESLGRATCLEHGLPVFEPQVEVWLDGELVGRVDGLWREGLLVFEADGALKFTGAGVLPDLLTRQERIRDTGLDVVRAGWGDVTRRRAAFAARARARLGDRAGVRLRPGVELVSTLVRPVPLDTTDHYRWPPLPSATPRPLTPGIELERGVA